MIEAKLPDNESQRLKNLSDYHILDSLPEDEYDGITELASYICETPIALVSLIDENRQWFKSCVGLDTNETPRAWAFCAHAILKNEPLIVPNAKEDERFKDNPLVVNDPKIAFYAGIPLISDEGYPLGTLCVIDQTPRKLSERQLKALIKLATQVCKLLTLRKHESLLHKTNKALLAKNAELEKFSQIAAHDLKSPLHNIQSLSQLLLHEDFCSDKEDMQNMHKLIHSSAIQLGELIDGILAYSKSDHLVEEAKTEVDVNKLLEKVSSMLNSLGKHEFILPSQALRIKANKSALEQIFINLISNGIKYNDKCNIVIEIKVEENEDCYNCYVIDNGPGISKEKQAEMFELYTVLQAKDRNGKKGNGIGLATVKKLVEGLKGNIAVESDPGNGTSIHFSIAKH